mmetsp:Transcript_141/g.352  ORF Transcript_141/g.352 Transcript_141/m.352 type:complete len:403 (+) Transcript_141:571-1779(+)
MVCRDGHVAVTQCGRVGRPRTPAAAVVVLFVRVPEESRHVRHARDAVGAGTGGMVGPAGTRLLGRRGLRAPRRERRVVQEGAIWRAVAESHRRHAGRAKGGLRHVRRALDGLHDGGHQRVARGALHLRRRVRQQRVGAAPVRRRRGAPGGRRPRDGGRGDGRGGPGARRPSGHRAADARLLRSRRIGSCRDIRRNRRIRRIITPGRRSGCGLPAASGTFPHWRGAGGRAQPVEQEVVLRLEARHAIRQLVNLGLLARNDGLLLPGRRLSAGCGPRLRSIGRLPGRARRPPRARVHILHALQRRLGMHAQRPGGVELKAAHGILPGEAPRQLEGQAERVAGRGRRALVVRGRRGREGKLHALHHQRGGPRQLRAWGLPDRGAGGGGAGRRDVHLPALRHQQHA